MKLGLIVVALVTACSSQRADRAQEDAARAAACSVSRDAYKEARKALFDRGACDSAPGGDPEQCLPYVIIREAHFAHLERLDCPPEEK